MHRRRFDRRWVLLTVLIAVILALISCAPALAADQLPGAPQDGVGIPFDWIDLVAGAFVIPYGVQFLKRYHWDDEKTRAASFLLAAGYTVARYWRAGELDHVQDWSVTLGAILTASQISYNTVLKSKLLASLTAALGSLNGGPSTVAQRAGYQGKIADTPPPG